MLGNRDMIYVGMGAKTCPSPPTTAADPAKFYLLSAPAHHSLSDHATSASATPSALDLGSQATSQRAVDLPVHPPRRRPHLPARRRHDATRGGLGVEHHAVRISMTGAWRPISISTCRRRRASSISWANRHETRHLVMANEEAVLSPVWSIHSAAARRTTPSSGRWPATMSTTPMSIPSPLGAMR